MLKSSFFTVDERLEKLSDQALAEIAPRFAAIDEVTEYNQQKVLRAFIDHQVSETHFAPTTGYGYGDRGRDTLAAA